MRSAYAVCDTAAVTMIVQLVGPPACGKRTIGAALAERTGARLVDNHLINDPVFTALGVNGHGSLPPQAIPMAGRVRQIVHEAALAAPADISHIFTNWLVDTPEDARAADEIRNLARIRGADFYPVWLSCDPAEIRDRLVLPDRAVRNKLRDPSMVEDIVSRGTTPAPDDALQLDTSAGSPQAAAAQIVAWIDAHH
ncbi:hypothetical protein GCM10011492_36740 [Flexivirga endophytica]|uniref:Uncharacterized protein n=2 Tax=Flexivirga endophytica TaxID=1849103 RepID=A0A916TEL3_9MICO|nr:hypothetical protein GCM10011492_36740 [Flexivirga endophytica]GHB70558.1 hypothetical protein GCM10008112_43850 [Flexivirga endophytica]